MYNIFQHLFGALAFRPKLHA